MNVPFGLMGGIIALIFSQIYLSVSAIIGFLAIFAIAILNGIVLVSSILLTILVLPVGYFLAMVLYKAT
jgi:cobalt-zinc-cadmium resistance protein CzcA